MVRHRLFKRDWKQDTVYLYQFPRSYLCPQLSPFCLKVETWLRLAKIDHEVIETFLERKKSVKGKVPFIEVNGRQYHDSQLIIKALIDLFKKEDIDAWLTDGQRGTAHAVYSMLEIHCAEVLRYERFADHIHEYFSDKCWPEDKLPWPLKNKVTRALLQRRVMSRVASSFEHSREDNFNMALADIKAVSQILGANKFLFGDQISTIDCTLFALEAQVFCVPFNPKVKEYVDAQCPNLEMHFNAVKELLWSDWNEHIAVRPPPKEEKGKKQEKKVEENGNAEGEKEEKAAEEKPTENGERKAEPNGDAKKEEVPPEVAVQS